MTSDVGDGDRVLEACRTFHHRVSHRILLTRPLSCGARTQPRAGPGPPARRQLKRVVSKMNVLDRHRSLSGPFLLTTLRHRLAPRHPACPFVADFTQPSVPSCPRRRATLHRTPRNLGWLARPLSLVPKPLAESNNASRRGRPRSLETHPATGGADPPLPRERSATGPRQGPIRRSGQR